MILKPQIQTSSTIEVEPIKVILHFVQVFVVVSLQLLKKYINFLGVFYTYVNKAVKSEFNLPPPSRV